MAVSIVIATVDRPNELRETLASLLPLLRPLDEIIISDQSASDASFLAVQAVAGDSPQVRYVHRRLRSLTAARNVGWQSARCGVVIFVDDDVTVEDPEFLDRYRRSFAAPRTAAVAGSAIRPDGSVFFRPVPRGSGNRICGVNMGYRRRILKHLGGFDERLCPTLCDETDLALRILKRGYSICCAEDLQLIHRCASTGGCGNRERNDNWFRQTYFNYAYLIVKHHPALAVYYFLRYFAGEFRRGFFPGYRTLANPRFFWRCMLLGHLLGIVAGLAHHWEQWFVRARRRRHAASSSAGLPVGGRTVAQPRHAAA